MSRRRFLIGISALLVLVLAIGGPMLLAINDDTKPEQLAPPLDVASNVASRFLDLYVEPDGRVVRRDQGGDVVSEGQAYAMLISVAVGDRARFDSVWNWAQANLMQPNGLLAWQWKDGVVVDRQPATDADLDAARALGVAAKRFNAPYYANDARKLADAIAKNALAYAADGKPVLLAGPWAGTLPFYTNPSYHSPRAEQDLSVLTTDTRWQAVLEKQRATTAALIGVDTKRVLLPPDWAVVEGDGSIRAAGPPGDTNAEPKYSYDAVRLPVRLAESCDIADRKQAARLWTVLNRSQATRVSAGMSLDGELLNNEGSSIGAVAAAAGAIAAGDAGQAYQLLDLAERMSTERRSYYGEAWTALGRIMLTTTWLGTC